MTALFLSASDISISDAALRAVVGFIIVLVVLALLVGIFYLSGWLFRTKVLSRDKLFTFNKKDKSKKNQAEVGDKADAESDDEIVAAITAAVTVMLSEENDDVVPEFVIRRIVRKK